MGFPMHWIATLLLTASVATAQLIAYESFSGMPTGGGISGSGAGAVGWTQSSWQGATAPYHSIGNQAPNMTYQITNGGLVIGGDRCVILSTAPEPTSGTKAVSRTFPVTASTAFMSLLVRPLTVGTGSDEIKLLLQAGSNALAELNFKPNLSQTALSVGVNGFANTGTYRGPIYPQNTYLIVLQFIRTSRTSHYIMAWINPPNTMPSSGIGPSSGSNSSWDNFSDLNGLSLSVSSSDTGGPSTSVAIDEVRVGYTWGDVVPQSTTQTVVPTLSIAPAIAVNWQSKTNKSYQPQRSYDMINWTDFGATISGNGQQRHFLDSADQVPKSFYRVLER
jgi:hypothetical protein